MSDIGTYGTTPGTGSQVTSSEAVVWTGRETGVEYSNVFLTSGALDPSNTPTTTLRPGLVLGKIISSGLYTNYSPGNTDGSEVPRCILDQGVTMLDQTGTPVVKEGHVVLKGILQNASLITSVSPYTIDYITRRAFTASGRYVFDDDLESKYAVLSQPRREQAKTTAYTVTASDAGSIFTTTGATGSVAFTLPAIATSGGLAFEFMNTVAQTMSVASAEGTNIVFDAGATRYSTLTASTSSHQGGHFLIWGNAAGTLWYVRNYSSAAAVITPS
jgi:hypothetical protein